MAKASALDSADAAAPIASCNDARALLTTPGASGRSGTYGEVDDEAAADGNDEVRERVEPILASVEWWVVSGTVEAVPLNVFWMRSASAATGW